MKGPPLPAVRHATLGDALDTAARSRHGLVFVDLRERERRVPWSEILAEAARGATALVAAGVRPGDRVALVLRTSPEFVTMFFAALLARAIPVPLYPPVRLGRLDEYHAQLARMLQRVGARMVVSESMIRGFLGRAIEQARPPLGCRNAAELSASRATRVAASPDDIAFIQFSSGSTVDPKPVALSHRNLGAQLAALESLLLPDAPPIGVSWLPLYHDMGLIGCLLLAVYHPGTLVLLAPEHFITRPALWLRAIARHRAGISPAPNFAYALCARRVRNEELAGLDLSCWRHALDGAEPIAVSAARRFCERFARVGFDPGALQPVYGLSEAALAVTFTKCGRELRIARRGAREIASVGRPVPGMELVLREGRVFVRGASVMTEYFGDPEATARAIVDGWLDTGDLGFVREGELYISGRAKDVVIVRGANHSAQEFEECLDGIDGVRAGCAVALGFVPPDGDGEELLILAEHTGSADAAAIRAAILERTGVRAHTVALLEPGTLPRTSSGKLRRGEALRRFCDGSLAPPRRMGAFALARELVRSAWAYARIPEEQGA